jgi:gamma-tubulin complex component 5
VPKQAAWQLPVLRTTPGPTCHDHDWREPKLNPTMIPPSNSDLSAKSQWNNNSSRPPSRNTSRPSSSATPRPPSSLSTRPLSSASTRPQSRFSQRPHSRHARSRLVPICQTLVSQITGIHGQRVGDGAENEGDEFGELVEYAVKNLENSTINKASASVDLSVIDRQISGYVLFSAA